MSQRDNILGSEIQRYQSKGFGAAIACAIIAAFVVFWKPSAEMWWVWAQRVMQERDWNIQFFYLVFGHGVTLAGINIVCNVTCAILYWGNWPIVERYKVLEEPWPWQSDPEAFKKQLGKTFWLYLLNMYVLGPLVYGIFYMTGDDLAVDYSPKGVPSTPKMLAQLIICMMMEDFTFHCSHRFLHLKQIYPYVHKIHHEYNVTISISAQHAHPLEFVLGNMLPTAIGPLLLGKKMHISTLFTWYALRHFESIDGHTGYEFSFSPFRMLPMASDYGYHVYHHSHNIGNFSSFFTFWDTVFGSNKAYFEYLEEKEASLRA